MTADAAPLLLLFDGSALAYRAHFAFANSNLSARGRPTGATFGFANEVHRILKDVAPDRAAMIFDPPGDTFRHEMYPAYKATRQKMPDDLREQLEDIHRASTVLGLEVLAVDRFEADDVIATLALRGAGRGERVLIVTGDKDFMQIVGPRVGLYNVTKRDRAVEVVDEAAVEAKFGVPPSGVIDVLALMGDSSDNVPGVPGIGPKTAKTLIRSAGSLEALYEDLEAHAKPRIAGLLREHEEQARLSKRLVTIDTDAPLPAATEHLEYTGPRHDDAAAFFRELDFRTLSEEMTRGQQKAEVPASEAILVTDEEGLEAMIARLEEAELFAFDTETTSLDVREARLVGLSFAVEEGKGYYVPLLRDPPVLPDEEGRPRGDAVLERLRPLLEDERPRKCGQNLKYDLAVLAEAGVRLRGIATDALLASYLTETTERERNLDALAVRHLDFVKISTEEVIGKGADQITMDLVPIEQVARYAAEDADISLRLCRLLAPRLDEMGVRRVHDEVEIPLIEVLASMQRTGVRVDRERLREMQGAFAEAVEKLEREIHELAGHEFTILSPKQLGVVLFDELKVHEEAGTKPKRGKTGYQTGQEILESLAPYHPLPEKVLAYRGLTKLLSTYVKPLPDLVSTRTGRIHTSFNQAVAATGRLSSSDPNLQNIPIRSELGRPIRRAFVPTSPEHRLVSADYSQVELRILAHFCADPAMIAAFEEGIDIHRDTAARVFEVPPEEVDASQRSQAKAINFGILYGMGAPRLARQTQLTLKEAKAFIARYFETYPAIAEWLERTKEDARQTGQVRTLLGRVRELPDLNSTNGRLRAAAENMAVNTPIQGSAADLLKLAMVRLYREMQALEAKMILTVHDELVFDVPLAEVEAVKELVRREMEEVHPLRVPLEVEIGVGRDWLEAH